MKRLLKLIVWLVGGVVSLLVVAVVVVPLLFDPNDHKQRIAEQIEQHTGLPVRIDGDIKLTVFPWLGVELGRVELGQAPGFTGDAFARTASMQVRVKLLPLLSKQIEMDTVTIAGLELHLARNAEGHGNWEPLLGAAAGGAEPSSGSGAGGPPPVAVLAIGGLDLQNAALTWDDALTGQSYKVSALDLRTGALDLSRPVDLTLEFQVSGGTPALAGTVSLNTAALVDPQAQTLRATGLTLSGNFSQSGPLGGPLTVKLSGDLGADGARQTLSVSGMALDASVRRPS